MLLDYKVPFYSNTPDNTHCFQAALRMILKYFWKDKDFTWKELERITAKPQGLWTWPLAGMVWLHKNGFKVRDIEIFDYSRFIKEGEKYLFEFYGKEAAQEQIKNSDIDQEKKYAKKLLKSGIVEFKLPTIDNLKDLLKDGYLAICLVNSKKLNNKKGYTGHFVVIKGYQGNKFILHDPGLPPQKNRKIDEKVFEKAWAYPDDNARNLTAIKFPR